MSCVKRAVDSIHAYVAAANIFVVLCPSAERIDSPGTICDFVPDENVSACTLLHQLRSCEAHETLDSSRRLSLPSARHCNCGRRLGQSVVGAGSSWLLHFFLANADSELS